MTKITQADIECWKAIFSLTDEQVDVEGDDKRGLELLAAHREAAFEAGREHAEREVVEWLQLPDEYLLDGDYQVRLFAADDIENKEHRND